MEVDDVALLIANNLNLNVFGPTYIALEEDGVVAESTAGFALGFVKK